VADAIAPLIEAGGLLRVEGTSETFAHRVLSKLHVQHPAGCWWWTRATNAGGYGVVGKGGRGAGNMLAHQAVYRLLVGPIPDGLEPDHLCRNPPCCNPDHLEIVTPRENVMRGYSRSRRNAERTTCNYGHPWTPDNIYWNGKYRRCKECVRLRDLGVRRI
jgi:hypothetical protein